METRKLEANIKKYYVFSYFYYFALLLPYFIIYLKDSIGFSLTNIAMYGTIYSFTVFIFEIPSGYIADKIGRKNSIIIGTFFAMIFFIILYFTESIYLIMFIAFIEGISTCFISGADSALLYDTLIFLGKEKDYKKIDGRAKVFQEAGVISASLIATLIYLLGGIKAVIIGGFIVRIVWLFVILTFKEPPREKSLNEDSFRQDLKNIFNIFIETIQNKRLRNLLFYAFLIFGFSNAMFMFYQPYFSESGLALEYFGYAFAILSIFAMFGAHNAHRIEKKLGMKNTLILMPILLIISYLTSSFFFVWFGFLLFGFREIVRGMALPIINNYTNKLTFSGIRATVLSILSMFGRLGYAIVSLIVGIYADIFSLKLSFFYAGLVLIGILGFFILMFRNTKNSHVYK